MDAARTEPIFPRLSSGPRKMDDEAVARHQRGRLQGAMVEAVARNGYQDTTLRELVTLAGVSKSTFYEHFDEQAGLLPGHLRHDRRRHSRTYRRGDFAGRQPARATAGRARCVHAHRGGRTGGRGARRDRVAETRCSRPAESRKGRRAFRGGDPQCLRRGRLRPAALGSGRARDRRRDPQLPLPAPACRPWRRASGRRRHDGRLGPLIRRRAGPRRETGGRGGERSAPPGGVASPGRRQPSREDRAEPRPS